jgi:hypothetical protein
LDNAGDKKTNPILYDTLSGTCSCSDSISTEIPVVVSILTAIISTTAMRHQYWVKQKVSLAFCESEIKDIISYLYQFLTSFHHITSTRLKLIETKQEETPWPVVRKRNIPTERPPLVGEVSANFSG